MTNLARWSSTNSLSKDWAERAQFVARFIAPDLHVLDLGCGAMDIERFIQPSCYTPVDLVARDGRTVIVDFNQQFLPEALVQTADLVTMLGLLEYIDNVDDFLGQLAKNGKSVLLTYCASELNPGVDRRSLDWINDFSTGELTEKLTRQGFEITQSFVFARHQLVVLATVATSRPHPVASPAILSSPARKSLVVAGHYGRGNCGDEALLQGVFEAFHETHDIIVSVDELGAFSGFWDWYPYNKARIIHRTNDSAILNDPNVAGIIVGGGGLPWGYAAQQVVAARVSGKKAALAGVDFRPAGDYAAVAAYCKLFDFIALRSGASCQTAESLIDGQVHHGGDWALALPTDAAQDIVMDGKRALLTLREYDLKNVPASYARTMEEMLGSIRQHGFNPCFLPFCPEDERFLDETGLVRLAPVERAWWNPRRMKQWIASSGLMLTFGRLHPMIFAASAGTPVAHVAPPHIAGNSEGTGNKITEMTGELGVANLRGIAELEAFLASPVPADPEKVQASARCREDMILRLRALFEAG